MVITIAEDMENILESLREDGVLGSAIISKNGNILSSDLQSNVREETFAIMMATILGATQTVNSDLSMGSSSFIVIYSQKGKIIVANIGEKEFVAVITERNYNTTGLFGKLENITQSFRDS